MLDFCSSWISHYPERIEAAAKQGEMTIVGMGMNETEFVLPQAVHPIVRYRLTLCACFRGILFSKNRLFKT